MCILNIFNIHSHWVLFLDSESFSYKMLNTEIPVLSFCSSFVITAQIFRISKKKIFFFLIAPYNTRCSRNPNISALEQHLPRCCLHLEIKHMYHLLDPVSDCRFISCDHRIYASAQRLIQTYQLIEPETFAAYVSNMQPPWRKQATCENEAY